MLGGMVVVGGTAGLDGLGDLTQGPHELGVTNRIKDCTASFLGLEDPGRAQRG